MNKYLSCVGGCCCWCGWGECKTAVDRGWGLGWLVNLPTFAHKLLLVISQVPSIDYTSQLTPAPHGGFHTEVAHLASIFKSTEGKFKSQVRKALNLLRGKNQQLKLSLSVMFLPQCIICAAPPLVKGLSNMSGFSAREMQNSGQGVTDHSLDFPIKQCLSV